MQRRNFVKTVTSAAATVCLTPGTPAEPLTMAYFHDYPPFSWEENGDPIKGILIDILNEALANRMGLNVVHRGYPWARAQQLVRSGKADGLCTVVTPERLEYAASSQEPVIKVAMRAYAASDHPDLATLREVEAVEDLRAFQLASYIGNGWAEQNLSNLNVTWTRTLEQTMRMVALQRVDLSVDPEPVFQFFKRKLGYSEALRAVGGPLGLEEFCLMLGKNSSYRPQMGQFDDVIKDMRLDGTIKTIQDAYLIS